MLAHRTPRALLAAALLTAGLHLASPAHAFAPLTSAFTYQGEVAWNGTAPSATVDLRFRLFDDAAAGAQVGITVEKLATALVDGRFTTDLDFGSNAFDGNERYLEIAVRSPAGVGAYVTLNPRQRLAAGPNSIYSTKSALATNALSLNGQAAAFYRDAANLNAGTIADARLATSVARTNTNQTFTGAMNFSNAGNAFTGAFTGNGSALTSLNANSISSGTILDSLLSSNVALKNAANVFTSNNIFNGTVAVGGAGILNAFTKFQVNGTAAANTWTGMYVNGSDAASWPFYGFATAGVSRAFFEYNGATGALNYANTFGDTRFTIASNGFIGVGSPAPTHQLDVNGSIRSRGADFFLNGRGGGVGNNGGSGRALVDAGNNSEAGTGLVINFGNDFGQTTVNSDLLTSLNQYVGVEPGLPIPQVHLGAPGSLPVGITKEANALINLDMNFRAGAVQQAVRGAAIRLDSRSDQPAFNFFARSAGTASDRRVLTINDDARATFGPAPTSPLIDSASFLGVHANTSTTGGFGGIDVNTTDVATGVPFYGYATGGTRRAYTYFDGVTGNWGLLKSGVGTVFSVNSNNFVGVNQTTPASGVSRFGVLQQTTGNSYGGMEVGTTSATGIPYIAFNTANAQRAWIEYDHNTTSLSTYIGGTSRQRTLTSGGITNHGLFGTTGINCLGSNVAELELRGGAPGGNTNADFLLRPMINGGGAQKGINIAATTDGNAVTNPTLYFAHYDGFGGYADRLIIHAAGNVQVPGALSKGGGSFKIDHPLDPENKYLYHSFVESPDMMNVYNGNITTDANGYATITLPDYFEALNKDFRYQLTIVDENDTAWSFAKVVQRVRNNTVVIRTSAPEIEVSWQITGIRKDNWAEQNRIPNAVDKEPENKGKYLHPEAFGQPVEKGITHRKDTTHTTPAIITDDKPRVMELNPAPQEVSQK